MKPFIPIALLLLCLLSIHPIAHAQYTLHGSFIDAKSGERLPFVTAVYDDQGHGFTSDIEGAFQITTPKPLTQFRATYIAYRDTTFTITPQHYDDSLDYRLTPRKLDIAEVYVTAGDPAALKLLRNALANRKKHDPASLPGYHFTTYSKLVGSIYVTNKGEKETGKEQSQNQISLPNETDSTGSRLYLFVNETVSRRHYRKPKTAVDSILSTRTSGLQRKMLPLVANTLHSLSFYEDELVLVGEEYVNPFSATGPTRYWYSMHDTLVLPSADSVFSIYFWPKSNKTKDDLSGYLQIHSNGYALQGAIAWTRPKVEGQAGQMQYAQPDAEKPITRFRISQTYQQHDDHVWFPKELRSNITIQGIDFHNETHISQVHITARERLAKDRPLASIVLLNPNDSNANAILEQYRLVPLRPVESQSYQVIDSLSSQYRLEERIDQISDLIQGYLPVGPVRFDLLRVIDYNEFEGYRLGVGLETNDRFSQRVSLGAYYAYGFRDRGHKYGAQIRIRIIPKLDGKLEGFYSFDRHVPGSLPTNAYRSATLRYLYVQDMDYRQRAALAIRAQVTPSINMAIGTQYHRYTNLTGYGYSQQAGLSSKPTPNDADRYQLLIPHLHLQWDPDALLLSYPDGLQVIRMTPPILSLHVQRGFQIGNMRRAFTRAELSATRAFHSPIWGQYRLQTILGAVWGDYPLSMGFSNEGVQGAKISMLYPGMLSTVPPGYFYHDYLAQAYMQYTLPETLAIRIRKSWQPIPCIMAMGLWGGQWRTHAASARQTMRTADRGFFELGLGLENVIPSSIPSLSNSFSIRYRLGAYQSPDWKENISFSLTLWTSFLWE